MVYISQCLLLEAMAKLKAFMNSMLQKAGKIRGLVRDLKQNYSQSNAMDKWGSYRNLSNNFHTDTVQWVLNITDYHHDQKSGAYMMPWQFWGMSRSWRTNWRKWMRNMTSATWWVLRVSWMDWMLSIFDANSTSWNFYMFILVFRLNLMCYICSRSMLLQWGLSEKPRPPWNPQPLRHASKVIFWFVICCSLVILCPKIEYMYLIGQVQWCFGCREQNPEPTSDFNQSN